MSPTGKSCTLLIRMDKMVLTDDCCLLTFEAPDLDDINQGVCRNASSLVRLKCRREGMGCEGTALLGREALNQPAHPTPCKQQD